MYFFSKQKSSIESRYDFFAIFVWYVHEENSALSPTPCFLAVEPLLCIFAHNLRLKVKNIFTFAGTCSASAESYLSNIFSLTFLVMSNSNIFTMSNLKLSLVSYLLLALPLQAQVVVDNPRLIDVTTLGAALRYPI